MKLFENIHHAWYTFMGWEKKITHVISGTPEKIGAWKDKMGNIHHEVIEPATPEEKWVEYQQTEYGRLHEEAKARRHEVRLAKAQRTVHRHTTHVAVGGFLGILALLLVRKLYPDIAEVITPVYNFLDAVVVPLLNWIYQMALKGINLLMNQKWFSNIIDWFASMAA